MKRFAVLAMVGMLAMLFTYGTIQAAESSNATNPSVATKNAGDLKSGLKDGMKNGMKNGEKNGPKNGKKK